MSKFLDIGKGLAEHSTKAKFTARGVADELFPFIYVASKRMGARAISEWLAKEHNVKLSHVSISKTVNNAPQHFKQIADAVFEPALLLEEVISKRIGDEASSSMFSFLWSEEEFQKIRRGTFSMTCSAIEIGAVDAAFHTVQILWFSIPAEVRAKCEPFLVKKYHDTKNRSHDNEANITE